jgi:hypothetical protein
MKRKKLEKKRKKEKKNIGNGNLDISQPQSNV